MKKALLFVSILFISIATTACINNLAVQELNTKAKAYLDEGNYQEAIERLKSSIDLDDTIFETHYNLAVAYTNNEDYANAIESYQKAIELNPDMADVYYSLAVAQGNLAQDLKSGVVQIDEAEEFYKPEDFNDLDYKPSEEILNKISELEQEAITNYNTYLQKSPNAKDEEEIKAKIKELEGTNTDEE